MCIYKLSLRDFIGMPSCGCVQEALPVTYKIYNRTDMVQEVEVEIEPSEAFMFSGNRQVRFSAQMDLSSLFVYEIDKKQ